MNDKYISYEEYKECVNEFWEKVKENLLVNANDDEIYHVYNTYRDDVNGKYDLGSYSGLYRKIERAFDMILRADDNNGDIDDIEEDLCDIYYWSIDKYRITEGEYERIFKIDLVGRTGFFGIEFCSNFLKHATGPEGEVYAMWRKLYGWPGGARVKIRLPYKKGDILKVNNKPYSNMPDYYVYLENENVFKRHSFNVLSYQNLFSDGSMIGYYGFLPCHIEVVPACPDKLFNKIAHIVRENSDEEIDEMKRQLAQGEGEYLIDYLNRIAEYEREIVTGIKNDKEVQKEEITLDEYIDISEKTKKLFMSMFAQELEADEVYLAKSRTRYDIRIQSFEEIFHDYDKMTEYICLTGAAFYDQRRNKEPLDKVMWWRIEKKKLFGSSYKTTMVCEMDASCNIISFGLGEAFYDCCHTDERCVFLLRRMDLVNYTKELYGTKLPVIRFPYNEGDIIYADKRPRHEPTECIYLGEKRSKYGGVEYLCLTRSTFKENKKFQVTTLNSLGECAFNEQPYFHLLEKRDEALDKHIQKAFQVIRKDKGAVLKILDLGEQVRYGGPDIIGEYIDSIP